MKSFILYIVEEGVKGMNPYEAIFQNTLDGNEQGVLAACRELLDEGYRPIDILEQGMIPAMDRLGELLSRGERFVPQVLISAKAMQSAVSFLQPILLEQGQAPATRNVVVVGTVQGDIHTIGKNLVSIMLQSSGCKVIDLGANVSAERFIQAIRDSGARVVAMSALLTSSMPRMRQIVRRIQQEDFGWPVKIILGGGPITPSFARELNVTFGGSMVDTTQKANASTLDFSDVAAPDNQ